MDEDRAITVLREERWRVEQPIAQAGDDSGSDRTQAGETGDIADPAERLTAEEVDDALVKGLQARLDATIRAEQRLDAGQRIPGERLEADPAAELTVEEATE